MLAREWLALGEKELPDNWQTFNARATLGACLAAQNKHADAEPLLLSGCAGMKQHEPEIPAESKSRLPEAIQHLVRLYEAANRPDRAAEWRKQLQPAQ